MSFRTHPSHLSFVADFPDDDDDYYDYDSDDTTHRQALKSVNETDREQEEKNRIGCPNILWGGKGNVILGLHAVLVLLQLDRSTLSYTSVMLCLQHPPLPQTSLSLVLSCLLLSTISHN